MGENANGQRQEDVLTTEDEYQKQGGNEDEYQGLGAIMSPDGYLPIENISSDFSNGFLVEEESKQNKSFLIFKTLCNR
ncbi:hypothetical protein DICVIV_04139 [Dictyocaulus viviparus]|uniref:Uncharacterized protein n=1 Tax=Dictyocaulus viviparus TaxID=29172 RepID=A0A0D8XYL4_DICVI|nr:hypothetical protein DICVIV_04139 [Dictyocaulus viviparus]